MCQGAVDWSGRRDYQTCFRCSGICSKYGEWHWREHHGNGRQGAIVSAEVALDGVTPCRLIESNECGFVRHVISEFGWGQT